MAKELIGAVLNRNKIYKVSLKAKKLLEKVQTESLDNWYSTLIEGCEEYSLNHSDEEAVAFAAAISLHRFIIREDRIKIRFFATKNLIDQVSQFSISKDMFKVQVLDSNKKSCEYFYLAIVETPIT